MFHLGKVLDVLPSDEKGARSADNAMHVLVEMWDENLIIFRANPLIAHDIKEGCFVLVDYSPIAVGGAPVPKHEIVAIVSEAKGKKILAKLRASLEEKKKPKQPSGDQGFFSAGKMIG